jgi:alkylated DNA repair dioxygenase AlkB
LDNDFTDVHRHDLDEHSWVEVVPGLIRTPELLFAQLLRDLEWSQRRRWVYNREVDEARLTAEYLQIDVVPSPSLLLLAQRLSTVYDLHYDGLWANLYRDQRDSTGWHRDWIACKRDICTVPVLTLGHPRRFLMKARAGGVSRRFTPDSGDLIVIRGRCQTDWLHAVPKQATPAAPRISVNFSSTVQLKEALARS